MCFELNQRAPGSSFQDQKVVARRQDAGGNLKVGVTVVKCEEMPALLIM